MKINRCSHPEYACFAFNHYGKYVSFFKFALIFQGSTCYDKVQIPLGRWRFLRTLCWPAALTYKVLDLCFKFIIRDAQFDHSIFMPTLLHDIYRYFLRIKSIDTPTGVMVTLMIFLSTSILLSVAN